MIIDAFPDSFRAISFQKIESKIENAFKFIYIAEYVFCNETRGPRDPEANYSKEMERRNCI